MAENNLNFHSKPDYNNKDVTQINRVDARTPMYAYSSEAEALAAARPSSNCLCLDGVYKFTLAASPEAAEDFYSLAYDASKMAEIQVPGNWETQGFGDPIYTNNIYPWDLEPEARQNIRPAKGYRKRPNAPHVPRENPTGCYRKAFTLPEHFKGQIYLRFDGVETAYYLWMNGIPVGYSQDSKLPSEFNVTEFVRPGENILALQVMRFADSTYLEDQDYWYLSGIFRSVWLYCKPEISIEDYKLTALPDLNFLTGAFTCDVKVTRKDYFADYSVKIKIFDGETLLGEGEAKPAPEAEYRDDVYPTANTARVKILLPEIELWTPEHPKLYTAVISLMNPEGEAVDFESASFGFKTVEVKGGIVYLNGARLIIRGVNRHEHYPLGRAVPREHAVEEIRQMKRMNINSVRTCHYPDSPLWYELCDRYGILLICECDLETHGVMGQLTHDPAYALNFLERAVRMVQTYKNHVSIYSWSLGNESGTGPNHAAMYGFIKEYDQTRLCQYEAGEPGKNISDIRGNMYAALPKIRELLSDTRDDRPVILVEYLYQISNAGGGAVEFRNLVENYERFQGGYVWDWQDKCLKAETEKGLPYSGHGGDFNESFIENECPVFMTNNGVVTPDLTWKPVAKELKEVYAPIFIERPKGMLNALWSGRIPEEDEFVLKNRSLLPASAFECQGFLREDGKVVAQSAVSLPDLAPGEEAEFRFSLPYGKKPGCEYHMDFVISRKEKPWYAQEGDWVFACQFPLREGVKPLCAHGGGCIEVSERGDETTVTGEGFAVTFRQGLMASYEKNGFDYLSGGEPNFARPRSGLDVMPGWGWYELYHPLNHLERKEISREVSRGRGFVSLRFGFSLTQGGEQTALVETVYTVYADSSVRVDYTGDVGALSVPRAGMSFTLPAGFEKVEYFGYGENECYCDRMASARLGVYGATVEGLHFAFLPPSENGGHEGTRYVFFTDENGRRVKFSGTPFHFDARHQVTEDYRVLHEHELPKRPQVFFNIDAAHGPIGSNMAWSTIMDPEKMLGPGRYSLSFLIETE